MTIVIKGKLNPVAAENLSFGQRLTAFRKYASTKVLGVFGIVYGAWDMLPQDKKAELADYFPALYEYKTSLFVLSLVVAFYRARMTTQAVYVNPS